MSSPQSNGSPRPTRLVTEAAGDVLEEILSLAGLQLQLGMADFREVRTRMVRSTAVLCVGLAFIMGAVPVVLAGLGLTLVELAGWPLWAALLTSGLVTLAIAGLATWLAVSSFHRSMRVFDRSQEQLVMNLEKVRSVLRRNRPPQAAARSGYNPAEPEPPPGQPR